MSPNFSEFPSFSVNLSLFLCAIYLSFSFYLPVFSLHYSASLSLISTSVYLSTQWTNTYSKNQRHLLPYATKST